ncbi:MAG: PAS domain S-box protein [Candidatus Omnitrophica bacterium]|nr:PAS domain S-box protein [Candidatus Omnitrophota bacterium]
MTKAKTAKDSKAHIPRERNLPNQPFDGSEESLRLLIDHVPGVIYLCRNDSQFTMLYLSEAIETLIGYPASDFLDSKISFVDLYHPEDSPRIFEEVSASLKRDKRFHLVYRLKHRSGNWKWIEEFGLGIEREGRIDFLEGYLRDISERMEAEEALKASETRWRTLVQNAPNHVTIIDPDGNHLYINRVEKGFDPAEVLRSNIYKWVPEKHHGIIRKSIEKTLKTGKPVKYQVEVTVPGVGSTWWSCCMGLIDPMAQFPQIMIISTDITRERKAQEELSQARSDLEERVRLRTSQLTEINSQLEREILEREKTQEALNEAKETAETANRAKGDFIASMSHELRTPLTSILGFVGLLEGERHGSLNESQIDFVGTIRRNAEHLLSLINDILDVAKSEAGQDELTRSVVDLDNLVRRSLEMISSRALESGVEIAPSPTHLGSAIVDERKVRQIILNLLANACKFTPAGGEVGVRGVRSQTDFQITIWDTGIGIPPQAKDSIFEEFKQVDSGDSRKYPGTGLGLTLAKKFVEIHGGRIWVESKLKQGSRFTFSIPLSVE